MHLHSARYQQWVSALLAAEEGGESAYGGSGSESMNAANAFTHIPDLWLRAGRIGGECWREAEVALRKALRGGAPRATDLAYVLARVMPAIG